MKHLSLPWHALFVASLAVFAGCLPDTATEAELEAQIDAQRQKQLLGDTTTDGGGLTDTTVNDVTDAVADTAVKPDAPINEDVAADGADDATGDATEDGAADTNVCVACKGDSDCSATTKSTCQVSFCIAGCCLTKNLKKGQICLVADKTLTQCESAACDDKGECVVSAKKDDTSCGLGKCGKKCVAGQCVPETSADWDDGNPCTKDFCDQGQAVKHDKFTDLGFKCDDGKVCTENDACIAGTCAGTAKTCDDGIGCTHDICIEGQGGCTNTPKKTGHGCDDGDPCTTDACGLAVGCTVTGFAEKEKCDDGDKCTGSDTCAKDGSCVGDAICKCAKDADCTEGTVCRPQRCKQKLCKVDESAKVVCPKADSACFENVCDPTVGGCKINAKNEGKDCDDGDQCATGATCTKGVCGGAKALDCDDNNGCTSDSCTPSKGCVHLPMKATCDDNDPCTSDDACDAGSCTGKATTCDDGLPCTFDACDSKTGKCGSKPDNTKCDDGNACTTDSCDGKKGCVTAPNNKGTCDDGDKCTDTICKAGGCFVAKITCACSSDKSCDDGNPCTTDSCKDGKCQLADKDGGACDTADKCQAGGSGVCKAGICTSSNKPKDCSSLKNACNNAACNPTTGKCEAVAKADGSECDADKNGCTVGDACKAGKCVVGKAADCSSESDACNTATCKSQAAGTFTCAKAPRTKGEPCEDGDYCTIGDQCDGKGACAVNKPRDCKDLDEACASGVCDEKADLCVKKPKSAKTKCNDSQFCTIKDACDGKGVCKGGEPRDCGGGLCVVGQCSEIKQKCSTQPDVPGKSCSDNDMCTTGDKCDGKGKCLGKAANCDDGKTCTKDSCDGKTGKCVNAATKGAACTDGNACTVKDLCDDKGTCVAGKLRTCTSGKCSTSSCNTTTGACDTKAKAVGSACDDGNPCTENDTCNKASQCIAGPVKSCTATLCNSAACDAKTGKCAQKPLKVGTGCTDNNPCTLGDNCNGAGKCLAGTLKTCTGDDCRDGVCDSKTGKCGLKNKSDGVTCDDNNACTKGDKCKTGLCQPGVDSCDCKTDSDCLDGNPCTKDSCADVSGKKVCKNTPLASQTCDDFEACTTGDTCSAVGKCVGSKVECDDKNVCTDDSCDTNSGKCINTIRAKSPCDDGNKCTAGDLCSAAGKCAGSAVPCDDKNQCTKDVCDGKTGKCGYTPQPGAKCDDGLLCVTGETCDAKALCVGKATVCDDKNACTADSCDAKTGKCVNAAKTGSPCSDGNKCTLSDACTAAGKCKGKAKNCDDGNACTNESCDAKTGACSNKPATGKTCSDGNKCTQTDTCDAAGKCVGTNPVKCTGDQCSNGTCNPADGKCGKQPKKSGTPCDDKDACTPEDACDGKGACAGLTKKFCAGDDCGIGICVSPHGQCAKKPKAKGTKCSDGDPCTLLDACDTGGKCVGGTKKTCQGNACNDGVCNSQTGGCALDPRKVGTVCNDSNACTQKDECDGKGKCEGHNPKVCSGDACNDGLCDPGTGQCAKEPKSDGLGCSDGNACTSGDSCKEGACAPGSWTCDCQVNGDCDDKNTCTTDSCITSGGKKVCQNKVNSGSNCNDGNPCTLTDKCNAAGVCAGAAKNCDDNNPCTIDACSKGTCSHTPSVGKACNDSNGCTTNDACTAAGTCKGKAKVCDDVNPCTNNTCTKSTGKCTYPNNTASCNDGKACTTGDKCSGGSCTGTAKVCNDSNSCTKDSCNTATGACDFAPQTGATCNDGNKCTNNDACSSAGKCQGTAKTCNDANSCTADSCSASTGACVFTAKTGQSCDDGDACTSGEKCNASKACAGGTQKTCTDNKPCTADTCNAKTGSCVFTNSPSGTTCSDGKNCTTGDQCDGSGACHGVAQTCTDPGVCKSAACQESTGQCVTTNDPTTVTCNDGKKCTSNDRCNGSGSCTGTAKVCHGGQCYTSTCDPNTGACKNAFKSGSCDDGNKCTTGDTCYNYGWTVRCLGKQKDCLDGLYCTSDYCDKSTGTCKHQAKSSRCRSWYGNCYSCSLTGPVKKRGCVKKDNCD